ncbi:hypothetical protein [Bacillus pumilus]|uniref:hypothetical protein n=1 Tax=Bacillus pumilus TaxID=1408 RepID=UPI00119E305F|nr:hypothetical protein [Bacillus pumilus]
MKRIKEEDREKKHGFCGTDKEPLADRSRTEVGPISRIKEEKKNKLLVNGKRNEVSIKELTNSSAPKAY